MTRLITLTIRISAADWFTNCAYLQRLLVNNYLYKTKVILIQLCNHDDERYQGLNVVHMQRTRTGIRPRHYLIAERSGLQGGRKQKASGPLPFF